MSEFEKAGRQLRDFLKGLLGEQGGDGQRHWGRRLDVSRLEDLYAPRKVGKFEIAPAGIDNLGLRSTDTFIIPGKGTFTVNFDGFFRVARENPKSREWADANVHVNMVEMNLRGESELGPIHVSVNPDFVSAGQTFGPGKARTAAACRIAVAAEFSIPQTGLRLFNKEPVLLMNDAIESIPPVEDPNGEAHIYRLPLFDKSHPDAEPVAYLARLQYTVGSYLSREHIDKVRTANQRG